MMTNIMMGTACLDTFPIHKINVSTASFQKEPHQGIYVYGYFYTKHTSIIIFIQFLNSAEMRATFEFRIGQHTFLVIFMHILQCFNNRNNQKLIFF